MSRVPEIDDDRVEAALAAAREARSKAHAPYSCFAVGAAVLDDAGGLYRGCNVESASFGLTLCAERAALAAWVVGRDEGARVELVTIRTGASRPTPPCGACRQWLVELAPDAVVVSESVDGEIARWTARELLPDAFEGPEGGP
ncbi:MAG: cytidine deaminase [Planctomycetota bacterium]